MAGIELYTLDFRKGFFGDMENFGELVPYSFFDDLSDGELECRPASTEL